MWILGFGWINLLKLVRNSQLLGPGTVCNPIEMETWVELEAELRLAAVVMSGLGALFRHEDDGVILPWCTLFRPVVVSSLSLEKEPLF